MNEQDKQAFGELWSGIYYHDTNPKKEDVELGWQAALEYASGKQEPVAFYYRSGLIRAGYGIEIKEGTPLYTQPPAKISAEPYLWMTEWWVQGGPDNGEYEYETNHSNEFSCGRKDGFPLYRHPSAQPVQPAVAVNEQMLTALKLAKFFVEELTNAAGKYAGLEGQVVADAYMVSAKLNIAIAAAEAEKAKGGV